mgnify:FL=1
MRRPLPVESRALHRPEFNEYILEDPTERILAASEVEILAKSVNEGHITWETDVQSGFENAPKGLLRLYDGANLRKKLLEI